MEMTKRKMMTGNRFLSFVLDNENYCLEIKRVKELLGLTAITHIPQTPPFIKGVINLRGQIIPIIDLRVKFGLEARPYNKRTSIIVVEVEFEGEQMLMGVVVDSITEVVGITEEQIKAVPYINSKIHSDFIKGIASTADGMKIILDIARILSEDDFVLLKGIDKAVVNNEKPENQNTEAK